MRVTLFGATGLLGQELVPALGDVQLNALSSRDADLRDPAQVEAVIRNSQPDWIILSAAYTDVDGCEKNRDLAFAVNYQGAVNVARAARSVGARLMFLSSDYVFDGTKNSPYEITDPRHPISVYGETKARAEEAASRNFAGRLHRANVMALRPRGQVLPRNDSQAGGRKARRRLSATFGR